MRSVQNQVWCPRRRDISPRVKIPNRLRSFFERDAASVRNHAYQVMAELTEHAREMFCWCAILNGF